MKQAPTLDCVSFDPFSSFDDGGGSTEVGIGRCDVVEALMVALVVVVLDERLDLGLKVTRQEVIFEQHTVLQGLVPAFDLALCLWMEGCASHVIHLLGAKIVSQFFGDIAGTIVAE